MVENDFVSKYKTNYFMPLVSAFFFMMLYYFLIG